MNIVTRQERVEAKTELCPELNQWLLDKGFQYQEASLYDGPRYMHKNGLKITLKESPSLTFPHEFEISYVSLLFCDGKGNATLKSISAKENDWIDGCALLSSEQRKYARAVKVAQEFLTKVRELSEAEQ